MATQVARKMASKTLQSARTGSLLIVVGSLTWRDVGLRYSNDPPKKRLEEYLERVAFETIVLPEAAGVIRPPVVVEVGRGHMHGLLQSRPDVNILRPWWMK